MLDKLEAIKARFDQVGVALTNPEIINNQSEFGKYSKEYRSLEKIVIPYERYVKVLAEHKFAEYADSCYKCISKNKQYIPYQSNHDSCFICPDGSIVDEKLLHALNVQ